MKMHVTRLGRRVEHDDRSAICEDWVLAELFKFAENPFNPDGRLPMKVTTLCSATGLDRGDVIEALYVLGQCGFVVFNYATEDASITRDGIRSAGSGVTLAELLEKA